MIKKSEISIAVIGLGYVGLPLAVEFSKKFPVVGYDLNTDRINELKKGKDRTGEINPFELKQMENLVNSQNINDEEKIDLNFSIGKAYEDIKSFEKSFKYLEKGNNLKKNKAKYNNKTEINLFVAFMAKGE